MKHKPPTFTRGYNPEGAVNWLVAENKTQEAYVAC
ncbi:hypothetical protein A2U01_0106759, partial [Trifolium medium]|nr:hypothetical protein [Trifolium medium]